MNSKVSIVLPVYNVSTYLEECIRSLMGQDYQNIEIIPVNDGSTDCSGQILDALAAEDSRIKPIHKKNGGAASARNVGIDAATGQFICFVDSDDLVESSFISHLLETLLKYNADISVCGFLMWGQQTLSENPCKSLPGKYSKIEYLLQFLKDWECSPVANKMFRRECIGNIRMEEGHRIDDEFFTYQVVMNSNCVAVSNQCLYYYRLRKSSVMQDMVDKLEKVMLDRVEYLTTRYKKIAENIPQIELPFFLDTLDTITRYWFHSKDMPIAQKEIRRWIEAHKKRIRKLPIKQRLAILLSFYLKKPQLCGEANPLELEQDDYFS